eukprot:4086611-Pyramimonas_sp.AAC.1
MPVVGTPSSGANLNMIVLIAGVLVALVVAAVMVVFIRRRGAQVKEYLAQLSPRRRHTAHLSKKYSEGVEMENYDLDDRSMEFSQVTTIF